MKVPPAGSMEEDAPIGILGGTFDPVHNGHLALAALAADCFRLSRVLLIPAGTPPHKPRPGASASHRLAMLRLAVAGEPSFEVREEEVRRKGFSYTFDTVKKLAKVFPGRRFYFIVGSDNLCEIETWHRHEELLRMVTFCVAHRPGYSLSPPPALAGGEFLPFAAPEWGISATSLRAYLARGYRCRFLVPEEVRQYIASHRLYSSTSGGTASRKHVLRLPE